MAIPFTLTLTHSLPSGIPIDPERNTDLNLLAHAAMQETEASRCLGNVPTSNVIAGQVDPVEKVEELDPDSFFADEVLIGGVLPSPSSDYNNGDALPYLTGTIHGPIWKHYYIGQKAIYKVLHPSEILDMQTHELCGYRTAEEYLRMQSFWINFQRMRMVRDMIRKMTLDLSNPNIQFYLDFRCGTETNRDIALKHINTLKQQVKSHIACLNSLCVRPAPPTKGL